MKLLYKIFGLLLFLAVGGIVPAYSVTTYSLVQVTSVSAGKLYVFEQAGHVMNNTISSSALQTTTEYSTTELSGTESYVWTLENGTGGYCMRNVSLSAASAYLVNESSTSLSLGKKDVKKSWSFDFQEDGTALIRYSNDRFLGFFSTSDYYYKAYVENPEYNHLHPRAIAVYELAEHPTTLSLLNSDEEETTEGTTLYGNSITLTATVADGYDGELSVTSANSAVATASISEGIVTITPVAVGTTTIKVTAPATATYTGTVSKNYVVTVIAPTGLTVKPEGVPSTVSVSIASSGYGTYCSLYPLDFTSTGGDYTAWYVSNVSGTVVTFARVTGTIKGGVPIILYGTPGTYSQALADESNNILADNWLRGSLAPMYLTETTTIDDTEYTNFGLSGGEFVKASSGTLPAHKAYLPVPTSNLPVEAGARMTVVFDDTTTELERTETAAGCDASKKMVLDLQGRRVTANGSLRPGIYVVEGKKIVKR